MGEILVNTLTFTVRFSVALLIASMGEMFNQKSGLLYRKSTACEMAVGHFLCLSDRHLRDGL